MRNLKENYDKNFTFSAVNPEDLEEPGPTLITVVSDESGSLENKKDLLAELLKHLRENNYGK